MNWIDMATVFIKKHEGKRNKPYKDTVGKTTIGIGRNLDDNGLSDDEIEYLFNNDIKRAFEGLVNVFGEQLFTLPDPVKIAILNMMFNLGETRFRKFRKMIAAIKRNDWKRAAAEAKDSRWCRQVGNRCEEVVKLLLSADHDYRT